MVVCYIKLPKILIDGTVVNIANISYTPKLSCHDAFGQGLG